MGFHYQRSPQRGCTVETRVTAMWRGKQYTVTRLACGYVWKFESEEGQRNSFTMNYTQMVNAGFSKLTRGCHD